MKTLPLLLTTAMLTTAVSVAQAKDSTWLLCRGPATVDGSTQPLVVSAFESRAADGESRKLTLTMVLGGHTFVGEIQDGKVKFVGQAAPLKLAKVGANKKATYSGTVNLQQDFSAIAFAGKATLAQGSKAVAFTANLTCETIAD